MREKKEKAPTLADLAVRLSYNHPEYVPDHIRKKIKEARRFVLDDKASSFHADISHASFIGSDAQCAAALDQVRRMARAPHKVTWIEYNSRIFHQRSREGYGDHFHSARVYESETGEIIVGREDQPKAELPVDYNNIIPRVGILIEQHRDTYFSLNLVIDGDAMRGLLCAALPYTYWWTTDDSLPSHETLVAHSTYFATGMRLLSGAEHVAITLHEDYVSETPFQTVRHLTEFVGELRYTWALLACINDIPVTIAHVSPSRGFVAKGAYRKFLDHSTISLVLPHGVNPRKLAAKVVAASRRRAHQVRGHWRKDWHHPPQLLCDHNWNNADTCTVCHGKRIWIPEHQRGDATLGFVLHDYSVTAEDAVVEHGEHT